MRNNIMNDAKIENDKLPISKFDFSGSYYSTASVGEIGVACCRSLQPYTKAMMGSENFILTAPLVAPCYAKMHYKTWNYFVPIEDVWPNYSAYRTQQKVSRNGVVFRPDKKPCLCKDVLSLYALNGAKCTIFARKLPSSYTPADAIDYVSGEYFDFPEAIWDSNSIISDHAMYRAIMVAALQGLYSSSDGNNAPQYGSRLMIHTLVHYSNFLGLSASIRLDTGNVGVRSFCRRGQSVPSSLSSGLDLTSYVPLGKGDFTFYRVVNAGDDYGSYMIAYNFRMSSWGKRYKKTLEGLGYRFDVDAIDEPKEILRILAAYHAYYYSFGIDYWLNFNQTWCKRLETTLVNTNSVEITFVPSLMQMWDNFIREEFGCMWVTEQNDYTSAHTPQPNISYKDDYALQGIVDVNNGTGSAVSSPDLSISVSSDTSVPVSGQPSAQMRDAMPFYKVIAHGWVDEQLMKRMSKSVNRDTILGKTIEKQMRANGFGAYLERTRTNFIGMTSVDLNVSSVISNSDTFKAATDDTPQEGAVLGQRAGKCVGYKDNQKKLFYKTDVFGWWITLDAITCDSGYAQSEDMTTSAVELDQDYTSKYDGVGYQLDAKSIVNGARDESFAGVVESSNRKNLSMSNQAFGFAPRMNQWKIGRNCATGGFANKSTRDYFTSYNMEKLLYPDSFLDFKLKSSTEASPTGSMIYQHVRTFSAKDTPIAGPVWRYLARWPWLSNLLRIFAVTGVEVATSLFQGLSNTDLETLAKAWEMVYYQDDNYIIMAEHWFKAWSPMLPIEETYGTIDPERKMLEYIDRA